MFHSNTIKEKKIVSFVVLNNNKYENMHFCDFLNHSFGGIMLYTVHSAQVWGLVQHLLQVT